MRPLPLLNRLGLLLVVTATGAGGALVAHSGQGTSGDPAKGKAVFEQCAACHSLDDNAADGPSLKGVFGRTAGTREDYRYSAALVRSGVVWNESTLDAFVTDPQAFIRGNRMSFAGVPEKADRGDLIAYLLQATRPNER
jgi:cytochrome c